MNWNDLDFTSQGILLTAIRHKKTAVLRRDVGDHVTAHSLVSKRLLAVFREDEDKTVYNITDLGRSLIPVGRSDWDDEHDDDK